MMPVSRVTASGPGLGPQRSLGVRDGPALGPQCHRPAPQPSAMLLEGIGRRGQCPSNQTYCKSSNLPGQVAKERGWDSVISSLKKKKAGSRDYDDCSVRLKLP